MFNDSEKVRLEALVGELSKSKEERMKKKDLLKVGEELKEYAIVRTHPYSVLRIITSLVVQVFMGIFLMA